MLHARMRRFVIVLRMRTHRTRIKRAKNLAPGSHYYMQIRKYIIIQAHCLQSSVLWCNSTALTYAAALLTFPNSTQTHSW